MPDLLLKKLHPPDDLKLSIRPRVSALQMRVPEERDVRFEVIENTLRASVAEIRYSSSSSGEP